MNNNVKAVRAYRRNLSIALGLILLVFILIPVFVKSPCPRCPWPGTCWAA